MCCWMEIFGSVQKEGEEKTKIKQPFILLIIMIETQMDNVQ